MQLREVEGDFFRGGRVRVRKLIGGTREAGGKGGREESVAATADSKLEPREEVWGNIFNVTDKVRQEGNSRRAEMNI